jgi:hypothetical protein
MAWDFPASPTVGQQFTPAGGPTYVWNGYAWAVGAVTGGLRSKIISFTKQMNSAGGNVAYTGVGFTPSSIIFFAGSAAASTVGSYSMAVSSVALAGSAATFGATNTYASSNPIALWEQSGVGQTADVVSFDADGFTLNWTPYGGGSLTTNVITIYALCLQ